MGRHSLPFKPRHLLFALLAFLGLFVFGLVGAYSIDAPSAATTVRGLKIGDHPAGDLHQDELQLLLGRIRRQVEGTDVQINLPDGTSELKAIELGISLDTEATEAAALSAGRAENAWDRFRVWLGSFTHERQIAPLLSYDPEEARSAVARFDNLVVEPAAEPRLVLDDTQELTVEPGVSGTTVDVDAVVERLGHQVEAGGPFQIDAPTTELLPSINDQAAASVAAELNAATADGVTVRVAETEKTLAATPLRLRLDVSLAEDGTATASFDLDSLQRLIESTFGAVELAGSDPVFDVVEDQPVLVEEGSPPLECCDESAAGLVAQAVLDGDTGVVELAPKPSADPRLIDWARGEGVVEKVAEFTTEHACCQSRVSNIQRFADLVRGVYLVPGETLSLNQHVGERTREKGFVPAGTIIRGHLVPTVGGGVSQFATTMFNAAFFAGFDFLTYQSHSIYFSRYPYGREATISWPAPDLEIQNTTDYPALIWTSYTDTSITVSIYSTKHVEVEEIGQEVSSARACTRVDTFRRRTYPDGRQVEDSVFATYRPGEGLDCNGRPTDRPN